MSAVMTSRQRMLAAYRGQAVDCVPVAPEFWCYYPARVLGVDMTSLELEIPHWQALLRTFTRYGTEGWGIVSVQPPLPDVRTETRMRSTGEGTYESLTECRTPAGLLTSRRRYDRVEPSWYLERPVKSFEEDWPKYHATIFGLVDQTDWSGVRHALREVGESYLLELSVGAQFFDLVAFNREGGFEQGVFDLMEHEAFFTDLQERYIDYLCRLVEAACRNTDVESFYIGCCWSCTTLLGPDLWRRWDLPVIRAVARAVHAQGKLLHLHFHGTCREVLPDLAGCGADCICPFERPPGGDVSDVGEIRRILGDRVTMNGNVHTVETLIRGTTRTVEDEVAEIFTQWGPDRRRLILGTGDQVGYETPEENILAMIAAGRRWGRQDTGT